MNLKSFSTYIFFYRSIYCGHELIHGFDYDRLKTMELSVVSKKQIDALAKSMIRHYSAIIVKGRNGIDVIGHVNGTLTLNENIADHGGVALAWNAYKTYVKTTKPSENKDVTPTEAEKMFFL